MMDILKGEYSLNKSIPVPLYYQLKQLILKEIISGNIKVNECIPTELEISKRFGISRPTIRQAINELVQEGYLYRVKGKGTFVAKPKIDERFFQELDSFDQEMRRKGLEPSTSVLSFEVIAGTESINSKLNIPSSKRLFCLERLRFANGEPVVYLKTYLPYEPIPELRNEDFTKQSLYRILEEKYNKRVVKATRIIEAVNAHSHEASLLHIKRNAAVHLVRTTAFLADGTPIEYSVAYYPGDRNRFSIELIRK